MIEPMIASLLGEPFRLTLGEIADLTDKQIRDLYFHPRDDKGMIRIPEPVTEAADVSPEQADLILEEIAKAFKIKPEKLEELRRRRDERKKQQLADEQSSASE